MLTKWVYERLETPELYAPPREYDIPDGDWNDFVASWMIDELKVKLQSTSLSCLLLYTLILCFIIPS